MNLQGYINTTRKLISIESTKENVTALEKVIAVAIEELGDFTTERFVKNNIHSVLIYRGPKRPNKFRIILSAHLDVVPGPNELFEPKIKGGKLMGRGTYDMKAAAAVFVCLFKELSNKINCPLGLQLVTDEEVGGFNGVKHQITEGVTTEFALFGEPTDLKIEYEAKGITWLKIKTHGKNAHGAYPWDGQNAIHKLTQELEQIYKLFPEPSKFIWETTCNVGKVMGGLATNQVPGEAEAVLDIRRIPSATTESIMTKIKNALINKDTEIEVLMDEPAHRADKNDPHVKLLDQIITKHHGSVEYVQKCGASDARHYSAIGTTAICFGPIGAGLHTDEEWVDIKSLETYYQILKEWALRVSHP